MAAERRAVTLIELMIVLVICTIIMIPTFHFLTMTRQTAYKGFDRIDSLNSGRIILERTVRDLKMLCFNDEVGFSSSIDPLKSEYRFPVFPPPGPRPALRNPVNMVLYAFDRQKRTLTRSVTTNPDLGGGGRAESTQILGEDVVQFAIRPQGMFGLRCYEIEVKCQTPHPQRLMTGVALRTLVRSEFESRLYRHRYQISNRASVPETPR